MSKSPKRKGATTGEPSDVQRPKGWEKQPARTVWSRPETVSGDTPKKGIHRDFKVTCACGYSGDSVDHRCSKTPDY